MCIFFSGIETPSIALQQAGIDHQLEFGIEMDDTLRQAVEEMWSPREMHGNIEEACGAVTKLAWLLLHAPISVSKK